MILDKDALWADNLDVGGTPTDLDLGAMGALGHGKGEPITCFATADEGVTGLTGLSVQDSADGSSFEALLTITEDFTGSTVQFQLPSNTRRYVRCNLGGTVSGGNWTAGIVLPGVQLAE